jgi:hypothetical protein
MTFRTAAHEAIAKAFNGKFFGYIPDADHKRRQKDSTLRFGASPTVPSQDSLASFRAPLFNQGATGSCTFHGTPQAVYTSAAASGNTLPFVPSPRVGYALVRILERQDASQPLTDSGAMPSDLLTVLRQFGVSPIQAPAPDGRYSDIMGPDDVAALNLYPPVTIVPNVNDEPSLLDLETSGLKLLTGEYRIDERNPNFAAQIQASIASKAAAGIGIFVDSAFMNWNPSSGPIDSIDLNDPQGGGHWLSLDYHYTDASVGVVFGGPNSWGSAWPSGGPPPSSPFWTPGCYEITARCLAKVMSDCLLFPVRQL